MKYYIVVNEIYLVTNKISSNNEITDISGYAEIAKEQFEEIDFEVSDYYYIDNKVVSQNKEVQEGLSAEYAALKNVEKNINLLIELQADIVGGAV
jgi:hypothetical protein